MNNKTNNSEEYADFLAAGVEAPLQQGSEPQRIVKDLVFSPLRLGSVYVFGALIGYILSLAICAQCAVGLSPLAWKTATLLHGIADPYCPMLCGLIFGISPIFVSHFFLSRFQHRYLLFRLPWIPAITPLVCSVAMLSSGLDHSWSWQLIWLLSALATPYLVEGFSAWVLRQRT